MPFLSIEGSILFIDQPLVSQKYFSIDVIITLFKRIKKKLNLLVVHAF